MADIDLKKVLSTALKNDFWEDFCDALSEDLELFRDQIKEKKDLFNVRTQTDIDRLIEIGKTFGFTVDRSIDSSVAYTKNNLNIVTNRVKHKTSYTGYHYAFSLAEYYGQVYNYFVLNDILVRGFDLTETLVNLNAIIDYSLPFIGFESELYFKSSSQTETTLDQGWLLDGAEVTSLDVDIIRDPSIHLAVEFIPEALVTENSVEYLMNTTYLNYLLSASLYNKKTTEIAHAGVQVQYIMDESGYYDNLSNSTYSTDLLKLNCATTIANVFNNTDALFLDIPTGTAGNMDLDQESLWQLDQSDTTSFGTGTITDIFNSIEFGSSSKGIMSKTYPNVNKSLIGYWDFDETSGATFEDSSVSGYDGTLNGTYTRGLAIVGQGVSYDGSTAYGLANSIYIEPTEETFSFWVKGSTQIQSGDITLAQLYSAGDDYVQVQYNTISGSVIVTMTGNSITKVYDLFNNDDHLVTVSYSTTANQYELFIDGVSQGTQAFGGSIPSIGNYDMYVAVDQGSSEFFTGYIDEIRFYSRVLTDNEILFLFSSKLGNISSLGNVIATRTSDAITSLYQDDDWFVITARLDFSVDIQTIIDDDIGFPTAQEKTNAINALYEEVVLISEMGIKNVAGEMQVYGNFPIVQMTKNNHISFQVYIKK